ncbi:hypothetical protein RclHR1_00670019 [Rhizophagus clarus]|uniref:Glycosyltransferase family 2 protein n=1 Tax=Rhizophagus clarus TaxID=94130 RepID=A0A2Z6SJA1_9GLOM|nr:hypothetical protein RclHR1_00670019 [Rhizophagus clarus]GET00374.1 glycosyltransferase family 2 protein [Rhizophagus clarus]
MNIKLHFLFILLFITCFIPKLILSLNTNIISITDTNSLNERVIQSKIYSDNTILLRLINATANGCSDNQVFLKIINPDGTFNNNVVIRDDRILNENFCIPSTNQLVEGGITLDGIRIYALQPKLILLTYFCKLEQGTNVAGICGMIINWNNTIQDQYDFGQSCIDTSVVIQDLTNNDENGEFLLACYTNDLNNQGFIIINWSRYTVDSKNGTINVKDHGIINNINTSSQNFRNLFPTEDGGYGILTYRSDKLAIFLYFIPPLPTSITTIPTKASGPFQLYKPTQTISTLIILKCGISFVEFGYNCLIYLNEFNILVNIDFLDSGSIISTNEFIISNPTIAAAPAPAPAAPAPVNIINVQSLYYGGYIILIQNPDNSLIGLIYSNNGILFIDPGGNNWQMPIDVGLFYTGNLGVFTNNTIWDIGISQGILYLITNDLLTNYSSNVNDESKNNLLAFGNSFVDSVNPPIGSMIDTNPSPTTISISFVNLIELSNGNISIWQSSNSGDDTQDILRQSFSGNQLEFVNIENDNKTVTVQVLESTFNMPGQQYYVKVDNGFVKDLRTGQDLLGIRENRWNFNTNITTQDISTGSSSTIVRLTPEGTNYFRSLSSSNQEQFSIQMSEELSKIIPIDPSRLFTSKHYQFDPTTELDQLLFRMDVKGPNSELIGVDSIISSERVARDLNVLIRFKDYTGISKGDSSIMLDGTFGSEPTPDLWDKYRFILIGVAIGLAILLFLFYWATKSKIGRNYVIFMFAIILVDFGLDVAFIIVHGHDLNWLYPTTVVFLSFPILINSIATFMIITRETKISKPENNDKAIPGAPQRDKNSDFRDWWLKNTKTALFFVLFSSIDIEGLNIISSGYSGYKRFDAPVSDESAKIILIINGIVKFLEDIPQFIIYVIYLVNTVIPAIIPIIALSTCSVVIVLKSTTILGYGIFCPPPRSHYSVKKSKLLINGEYKPPQQPSTPPTPPFSSFKEPPISNGNIISHKTLFGRNEEKFKLKTTPSKKPVIINVSDEGPEKEIRYSNTGVIGSTSEHPIISDDPGQDQEEMEVIDSSVTGGGEGSSTGGYQTRMFEQFGVEISPQQQEQQQQQQPEPPSPQSTSSIRSIVSGAVKSISGSIGRGSNKRKGSQGSRKGKGRDDDDQEKKDDG